VRLTNEMDVRARHLRSPENLKDAGMDLKREKEIVV